MATRRLRVATATDTPTHPPKPLTLVEAAEVGDDVAELKAMRMRIARAIADPDTPARDLASLSRRQIEIGREIRSLEALAKQEADGADAAIPDATLDAASL